MPIMEEKRSWNPSTPTPPEMEPGIWTKLPEELLEHVLAFLPLKVFLNLRSTCKRFNSLIYSPSFISKHSSSSSTGDHTTPLSSFLLLSHPQFHHHFPLYDSFLGRWRSLALSLSLPSSSYAPLHLLSSSNGLFCFSLANSPSFLVCNLLSRSSRLIKFPVYPFAFDSLTLISSSNGYKIFMLFSESSWTWAFVYDSKVHSWTKFPGFHPIPNENSHQEGVFCDGYLYFTTPEPFSIVGFQVENGKWERPISAELPRELTFVRLVSGGGQGKLYMVGGIGSHGISRSVKLWELEGGGRNWVEVKILPEMMCRKFMSVCYHNYDQVYCFWHQGMVCVCCYTWPEILYYKVSRQTWHWLPRCPSLYDKWSCGFRWFPFVPHLYALV